MLNSNQLVYLLISNIFLFGIIIVYILYVVSKLQNERSSDIETDLYVLKQTIEDYNDIVIKKKINALSKTHDLNPSSQVNSIGSYTQKVEKLILTSSLEIINILTKRTRKNLFKHFSPESLTLLVKNTLLKLT